MDQVLVGPSGAGYTYLDLYPSAEARRQFAEWTAANFRRSGPMLNMVNQIQAGVFNASLEEEVRPNRIARSGHPSLDVFANCAPPAKRCHSMLRYLPGFLLACSAFDSV